MITFILFEKMYIYLQENLYSDPAIWLIWWWICLVSRTCVFRFSA